MKRLLQNKLALSASALVLGLGSTNAMAYPIASAESVVSFENFTLDWQTLARQVDATTDFDSLSVTSSQLTAANMTGLPGVSTNPSSSLGDPLVAESTRGTVDGAITGIPGATTTTVFNVPALPLTGNFSASASNEYGSPILNFENAAGTTHADLHNASYASLDTLAGTAGTSSSSTLASTAYFVSTVGGDNLVFNFDVGAYIGAYLSSGEAQSATAAWSVTFTLKNNSVTDDPSTPLDESLWAFFTIGDTISNNAPGTGTTVPGTGNASLTGGIVDLTSTFFSTFYPIVAGDEYILSANITTRAQVERVGAVPEPGSLALLSMGLLGLVAGLRKRVS